MLKDGHKALFEIAWAISLPLAIPFGRKRAKEKCGFDLNKSDFHSGKIQLSEYLNTLGGVKYGMLTNGVEWRLFDFSQPQFGGVEIARLDIHAQGDIIDCSKKAVEDHCYELANRDFLRDEFHLSRTSINLHNLQILHACSNF